MHTVIIGGGSAGLAASRVLQRKGVEHVVLERGRIGASWRTRWDSFCLNTPEWYSRLPDEEGEGDPDGFLHRDDLLARMERYRARFGLPIREGKDVTSVRSEGGGFVVTCADGESIACERVVVASGDQNHPRIPSVAASVPAHLHQLHAIAYRSPGALPEGGVLVVGSGQTGGQIAEELAEAGRRTWLCTSRVGWVPRRYRGRDTLYWAKRAGFFDHRLQDLPDPAMATWAQPLISGTRGGHSLTLAELARGGVVLLGRLTGFDGAVARISADLEENVAFGDVVAQKIEGMVASAVQHAGGELPDAVADPAGEPFPGLATMAGIRELDLDAEGISTVLWATGFGGDFSYLPPEALQDGRPKHQDGQSALPGLVFVGLTWLRKRDSGLLGGVGSDAEALLG